VQLSQGLLLFEGYRKFKTGTSNEPVALVTKQTEPRKIPHHAVVPLNGNKYGLAQNYRALIPLARSRVRFNMWPFFIHIYLWCYYTLNLLLNMFIV
jgi:hypothetical protein